MHEHELRPHGRVAMMIACGFGIACGAIGGPAGLVAVAWNAIVLAGSWRSVGARVGITALGLAAVYALAATSGFAGSDPEEIDRHLSFRLAVVAVGCAAVGVTSALVWLTAGARRR